jgi:hypothetical protein
MMRSHCTSNTKLEFLAYQLQAVEQVFLAVYWFILDAKSEHQDANKSCNSIQFPGTAGQSNNPSNSYTPGGLRFVEFPGSSPCIINLVSSQSCVS